MTGNVLINSDANRQSQYYVWNYGPGNESYYQYMYIDFAQPPDKVFYILYFIFYIYLQMTEGD